MQLRYKKQSTATGGEGFRLCSPARGLSLALERQVLPAALVSAKANQRSQQNYAFSYSLYMKRLIFCCAFFSKGSLRSVKSLIFL